MMQIKAYRLLLVDSRSIFRQGLRALLKKYPDLDVVAEVADGWSALEKARELRPDVILINMHVAGSDVLQTAAELRLKVPGANILILTHDGEDPNFLYQAIRAGARGCISEDSEVADLVKAVRLVAQGQAVLGPESLTSLINMLIQPDAPSEQSRVDRLTVREREVLELVAQGITNREIAERLYVSESTVRSHIHNILDKLQLSNRVQAAAFALTSRYGDRADGTLPPASLARAGYRS